jgi:hypothetical protein
MYMSTDCEKKFNVVILVEEINIAYFQVSRWVPFVSFFISVRKLLSLQAWPYVRAGVKYSYMLHRTYRQLSQVFYPS